MSSEQAAEQAVLELWKSRADVRGYWLVDQAPVLRQFTARFEELA